MSTAACVSGDSLAVLDSFLEAPGVLSVQGEHEPVVPGGTRCVILAVDLGPWASFRDAKRHLAHAITAGSELVRRLPDGRRLVVVAHRGPYRRSGVDRLASAALTRSHAFLVMRHACDVEFSYLDVTNCLDSARLAERVREYVLSGTRTHDVLLLDWSDVEDQSVAAAARQSLS